VDIYNASSRTWSSSQLNEARSLLSATSLPNLGVAIFAGGKSTSCCVCFNCCSSRGVRVNCDGLVWEKGCVLVLCALLNSLIIIIIIIRHTGDSSRSNVVDILNVKAGTWSTAKLSEPRSNIQAKSLPNLGVAIFAGGFSKSLFIKFRCCCVLS
jgi:hypothetical protein